MSAGSPRDAVFFTHVMKTGGISVSTALREFFGADQTFPFPFGDPRNGELPMVAKAIPDALLALGAPARSELRFVTVHQPAWVPFSWMPDTIKITVLRDPVERTVSHLRQLVNDVGFFETMTQAYADPRVRTRLVDYQCQIFGDPGTRPERTADLDCQIFAEPGGREPDITLDLSDPEVLAEFREHTAIVWATSIGIPLVVGPQELDDALERLDRYDVVGVTEQLGSFSALIEQRTGISMPPVGQYNVTTDAEPVPDALLDRIAADTAFDRRLYEHACQRADASPAE